MKKYSFIFPIILLTLMVTAVLGTSPVSAANSQNTHEQDNGTGELELLNNLDIQSY